MNGRLLTRSFIPPSVDNPGIVNSLLVNHGISVDECTVTKESLEDYFNEKMRGGIVNA